MSNARFGSGVLVEAIRVETGLVTIPGFKRQFVCNQHDEADCPTVRSRYYGSYLLYSLMHAYMYVQYMPPCLIVGTWQYSLPR